jgi:hypothetical protein
MLCGCGGLILNEGLLESARQSLPGSYMIKQKCKHYLSISRFSRLQHSMYMGMSKYDIRPSDIWPSLKAAHSSPGRSLQGTV